MKAAAHIVPFAGPDIQVRGDDWMDFLQCLNAGMELLGYYPTPSTVEARLQNRTFWMPLDPRGEAICL